MGGFSEAKESLEFLKKQFHWYYKNHKVQLPDRFGKREYAFILFNGKGMIRHISFNKRKEFFDFLVDRVPRHVYYSSAYYQQPDAPTMQEKKWMGAELIFDLDSDHLPDAEKLSYNQQLDAVKKEFIKLVDDFLLGDFGFDEKHVSLYFSGGRGYHCHVTDPGILGLSSNDRREIVDYITGRDLKDSLVFHEQVTGRRSYGRVNYPSGKSLKMPRPDEPGWRGRISRGVIEIINEIKNSDNPYEKLREYGVKKKDAEKLLNDLSEERIRRIKEGQLDQSKIIRRFFLNSALRKTAVFMTAGETDEPVTCDVKRLIRLPDSLHGKTGLKVKKIPLNQLEDFDPLDDAVVFPEETVKIDLSKKFEITIKKQGFKLEPGIQKVPLYLGVFLVSRKLANVI